MAQKKGKKMAPKPSKKTTAPKQSSKVTKVAKDGIGLGTAGQAIGAYLGGPLGSLLGGIGGNLIGKITGYGDYEIHGNSIMSGQSIPSFVNTGDGVIVSHREYLSDVKSSQNFTLYSFPINPGIATTFPWLSTVASNFESYEMLGLVFEYRPLSGYGVNSTNPALGYVAMATNYDPDDAAFSNKVAMESYEFSNSVVPCNGAMHPVECKPSTRLSNVLFVRQGAINTAASGTLALHDVGLFQIATGGCPGSGNLLGELWVTYHVRLLKPKMAPYTNWAHVVESPKATGTAARPFGTASGGSITQSNVPGFAMLQGGAKCSINFPGYYMLIWACNAANLGAVGVMTLGTNLQTPTNFFQDNTSGNQAAYNGTNSLYAYCIQCTDVSPDPTNNVQLVTFSGNTGATGMNTDLVVIYLGNALPLVNNYSATSYL